MTGSTPSREPRERLLSGLKDFQRWRSSAAPLEFSLLDYVGCVCTPDLFFAFVELLRPELVSHQGLLFIRSQFSVEAYDTWMAQLADPVAVQRMLNHIDIQRLLQGQEVSPETAMAVARCLAGAWTTSFAKEGLEGEAHGSDLLDSYVTLVTAADPKR